MNLDPLSGRIIATFNRTSLNAKEPDVFAEIFLFFTEALCVHQALSPGTQEKPASFFLRYTHRLYVSFAMWERGCIGTSDMEDFTLAASLVLTTRFFPALPYRSYLRLNCTAADYEKQGLQLFFSGSKSWADYL
jgi:hypothetical protein